MNIQKYLIDKGSVVAIWFTIILVALFISTSSLWYFVYRTENKYLSVINLYPYDITLKVYNQDIKLKKFDTYVRIYNTKEDIHIDVYKDGTDTEQRVKSLDFTSLKRDSQLIEVVLTDNENVCFLSADVTNAYYNTDVSIENVQIIQPSENNHTIQDIKPNYSYVYPGNSIQDVFPANRTNLMAILPIECSKSLVPEDQLKAVKLYQNYKPAEQRQYYEDQLKKIQGTSSIEELQNI